MKFKSSGACQSQNNLITQHKFPAFISLDTKLKGKATYVRDMASNEFAKRA